jgi:tRNA threonylcarbamoyladenosine biosynthesis protein TsaE
LIHLPILETRQINWLNEEQTATSAALLAGRAALKNATVFLYGDLGAGKTTFVRHLLRGLGVVGTIKSPSYSVMEVYDLPPWRACHFDFYRFNDPQEWEDAGFREVFADPGLKLVEWPEKAMGLMPEPDLSMTLRVIACGDHGESRHVVFDAFSTAGQSLLP